MRVFGDTLIVAVDAGYGNMKTVSCSFPTGLTVCTEKPYFTENLLIYDGRFYVIGSGHKEFTSQKIIDEDYYGAENEGHIQIQITNDSRSGKVLQIPAGKAFAQGIFVPYGITEDDEAEGIRTGGFGSADS